MTDTQIFLIVLFFAIVFLWWFLWFIYEAGKAKKLTKKPFVCPNCGEKFHAKWYNISDIFVCRNNFVLEFSKAKLKCPVCKQRDVCRWTGNDPK